MLFSNSTLHHAFYQIALLLRDVALGFPALLLTVASIVRLPSFIANIASACLSRQVSQHQHLSSSIIQQHAWQVLISKPTVCLRMFSLCLSPTTDFIR
jgi:hypothetical protein